MTSILPLFDNPRSDNCSRCAWFGRLSKTHVPPKAALNHGPSGILVNEVRKNGEGTVRPGRNRLGGIWGYWLCEACNNATSDWDGHYADLVHAVWSKLESLTPDTDFSNMHLSVDMRPGAIVRSMLAGMVAADRHFVNRHPTLVDAIFSGTPIDWPDDITLRLAVGIDGLRFVSAQAGDVGIKKFRVTISDGPLWTPRSQIGHERVHAPHIVIGSPPFLWFLGDTEHADLMPDSISVGAWMSDVPDECRHVDLMVPTVGIRGESAHEGSMMFTYEDMFRMPWQANAS